MVSRLSERLAPKHHFPQQAKELSSFTAGATQNPETIGLLLVPYNHNIRGPPYPRLRRRQRLFTPPDIGPQVIHLQGRLPVFVLQNPRPTSVVADAHPRLGTLLRVALVAPRPPRLTPVVENRRRESRHRRSFPG